MPLPASLSTKLMMMMSHFGRNTRFCCPTSIMDQIWRSGEGVCPTLDASFDAFPETEDPARRVGASVIRDLPRNLLAGPSNFEPLLRQHFREQVPPSGIVLLDQFDLPVAPPALEGAFAAGCDASVLVPFEIDQPTRPVALGEALAHALAVLPGASRAIAGHAHIEHTAR